jgi:hypothetical protein
VLEKNALRRKNIIYILRKEENLKKLSFAIENAEMIQENPDSNFALLALDYFASGENLHDMYVSEETLMRTADTVKGCPLVWKYDEVLDDVYTHDPDEVPCGFVPPNSDVTSKILPDGRTMLSTMAYVWKRYTGPLLSIFKRDGGKKPVSVEMSVFKTQPKEGGKTELLDFRYEGITVLGSYVTPAIPLANASVLSFSEMTEEYEQDLEKEFSLNEIIIPNKIRYNSEKGLEIQKEEGGGTSTGLAFARYLTKNKIITPDKVMEINNYFNTHKHSNQTVDWLLWGGDSGKEWAEKMSERIDKELVTFPYKSVTDINPALKGIKPPISLGQANAIAAQADSIGSDDKKNGWAIAISSFKKSHHVEDGKWVKNEGSTAKASADVQDAVDFTDKEITMTEEEKMAAEKAEADAKMAADEKMVAEKAEADAKMAAEEEEKMAAEKAEADAKMAADEEEKTKAAEEAKKKLEEEKGKEKKFEFPIEKMQEMFSEDDDEDDVKMAKAECAKGKEADFGIVMAGAYAKMCKMQEYAKKLAEDNKAYMAENEELKKFKAELETKQKEFAVNETMNEISEAVHIPDNVMAEMKAEADKYTFADIEAWKNYVKAKSFEFAVKPVKNKGVEEVGLPFSGATIKKDDLWANTPKSV